MKSDRFGLFHTGAQAAAAHGFRRDFRRAQNLDTIIARRGVQVAVDFACCRRGGYTAAAHQETLVKVVERDIGLFARAGHVSVHLILRRAAVVIVMRLLELRLMAVVFFGHFIEHALVVFGVLQIAFSQNTVARALRITRQRQVFFSDLHGVAADADIGAIAVKSLYARIDAALVAAAIVVVMVVVLTAAVAIIIVTAAKTSSVLIMSHVTHFALIRCPALPLFPAIWHTGTPFS